MPLRVSTGQPACKTCGIRRLKGAAQSILCLPGWTKRNGSGRIRTKKCTTEALSRWERRYPGRSRQHPGSGSLSRVASLFVGRKQKRCVCFCLFVFRFPRASTADSCGRNLPHFGANNSLGAPQWRAPRRPGPRCSDRGQTKHPSEAGPAGGPEGGVVAIILVGTIWFTHLDTSVWQQLVQTRSRRRGHVWSSQHARNKIDGVSSQCITHVEDAFSVGPFQGFK